MAAWASREFIAAFGQGCIAFGPSSYMALTSGCYKSLYGPRYHVIICKYSIALSQQLTGFEHTQKVSTKPGIYILYIFQNYLIQKYNDIRVNTTIQMHCSKIYKQYQLIINCWDRGHLERNHKKYTKCMHYTVICIK